MTKVRSILPVAIVFRHFRQFFGQFRQFRPFFRQFRQFFRQSRQFRQFFQSSGLHVTRRRKIDENDEKN